EERGEGRGPRVGGDAPPPRGGRAGGGPRRCRPSGPAAGPVRPPRDPAHALRPGRRVLPVAVRARGVGDPTSARDTVLETRRVVSPVSPASRCDGQGRRRPPPGGPPRASRGWSRRNS